MLPHAREQNIFVANATSVSLSHFICYALSPFLFSTLHSQVTPQPHLFTFFCLSVSKAIRNINFSKNVGMAVHTHTHTQTRCRPVQTACSVHVIKASYTSTIHK